VSRGTRREAPGEQAEFAHVPVGAEVGGLRRRPAHQVKDPVALLEQRLRGGVCVEAEVFAHQR
jgi:hypothetical protein